MSSVYDQLMGEVDNIIQYRTGILSTIELLPTIDEKYYCRDALYVYLLACYILKKMQRPEDIRYIDGHLLKMMTDKILHYDEDDLSNFDETAFINSDINMIYNFFRSHIVYKRMLIEFGNDPDIDEMFEEDPNFNLKR